ncbi:protein-disulfide reductase DsbD family protein [Flavobacterium granuli]|uniref:Thiol:disulfide interchange protein DsbD n=1 Tax=Flavobacterium granuli TaxID=280093 RepID=A0A1M5IXG0_9FLAO|nr:thioredoxin family protein [Flavobacterium granuli]PRZ28151.1 thiol:disulfide interchange protein DsbD [Flavobacterium granuli]SHG33048.1 Thiol:disulfide interchange protein DsbD [Flavobacterium granuli]
MKKIILLLAFIISANVFSQIHNPVKWSASVVAVSDTKYDLVIQATIGEGWHLYSQSVPENGPVPTAFSFGKNPNYELIGKPSEESGHTVNDPIFNMKIKFFENKAVFKQRINVLSKKAFKISGEVEFMVCDDANCLPPSYVDLNFQIPETAMAGAVKAKEIEKTADLVAVAGKETAIDSTVKEEIPADSILKEEIKTVDVEKTTVAQKEKSSDKSMLAIFIIAFFSGFAALLTPCVFPMIPMTVSFFTKQSKNRAVGIKNAIIYGLSIVIIYVLLGSLVSAIFGADALNALSTNVWFNIIFFVLLVVFAVSFLGAFEIMLPNSWANKVDSKADKGGLIGIFFMALALAIVSFSCTGPIVGTLLVQAAAGGNQIGPIVGMLGFSLALAIPFTLFAAFPGWLNSLPKSGGWLNTVKVVLGFLELALAFKFLSNADLVLQLHLLEREVFLAIWIAIFGVLAFYLFGKIQLPHDSPLTHISVGRLSLGLLSLSFTIYMIPGLWGAPLNLISAFPPAQHYSESPYGVGSSQAGTVTTATAIPEGAHLMAPHNIVAFTDYDLGMAYAKKVNKPVMLDFTGYACVNCRKMEQQVWPKEQILAILNNDVVLISLYVDDKRPLPAGEEIESKLRPGKKLKYVGQKWSEFQTIKYKANAQPFYVLTDHEGENLIDPVGYTPDVEEYHTWLKTGLANFSKK